MTRDVSPTSCTSSSRPRTRSRRPALVAPSPAGDPVTASHVPPTRLTRRLKESLMAPNSRLAALSAAGVSVFARRPVPRAANPAATSKNLITDKSVVGVTTNPTIFAAALANGPGLRRPGPRAGRPAAPRSTTPSARSPSATSNRACDVFSGTWEHSGGVDGRVSLEVSPLLARDTEATLAEALGPVEGRWTGPTCWSRSQPRQTGPAGNHPRAGRGGQHQRHADLLRRALPRGDRPPT